MVRKVQLQNKKGQNHLLFDDLENSSDNDSEEEQGKEEDLKRNTE